MIKTVAFLACLAASPALAASAGAAPSHANPAATPFDRLAALIGTWRNADNPASALRVHFYLTAGGTVLVEDWRRGTAAHSLTLYHRDGAALLATHYCPQGNQPRLTLANAEAAAGPVLAFTFRDSTDLDPARESHQHALAFDLTNPDRLVRRETYVSTSGAEPSTLTLVRVDPER